MVQIHHVHADPALLFCWRMVPWFIIKQMWIYWPSRECFKWHKQCYKAQQMNDTKEIDPHPHSVPEG